MSEREDNISGKTHRFRDFQLTPDETLRSELDRYLMTLANRTQPLIKTSTETEEIKVQHELSRFACNNPGTVSIPHEKFSHTRGGLISSEGKVILRATNLLNGLDTGYGFDLRNASQARRIKLANFIEEKPDIDDMGMKMIKPSKHLEVSGWPLGEDINNNDLLRTVVYTSRMLCAYLRPRILGEEV